MYLDLIEMLTICMINIAIIMMVIAYQVYKKNRFLEEILKDKKLRRKEINAYSEQLEEVLERIEKKDRELRYYVQDTMQLLQKKNSKHFQQLKDISSELIKRELNARTKPQEVNKKPSKPKNEVKKIRLND